MNQLELEIVIPFFGKRSKENLELCVSVCKKILPKSKVVVVTTETELCLKTNVEIISIDSLAQFPKTHLMNVGAVYATRKYIMFLDADAILPEGISQALENLPDDVKVYSPVGNVAFLKKGEFTTTFPKERQLEKPMRQANPHCGFCCIFERDFFLTIGKWDVSFTTYGYEDYELAYRVENYLDTDWFYRGQKFTFAHLWHEPTQKISVRENKRRAQIQWLSSRSTKLEKIDVVIPFNGGPEDELRACVSRVLLYLSSINNIYIINISQIKDINIANLTHAQAKEMDIINRIVHACNMAEITDDFLLMSDDHFLLTNIDATCIPHCHKGLITDKPRIDSYGRMMQQSGYLFGNDALNFDCHVPMIINKNKYLEARRKFDSPCLSKSLYGNCVNDRKQIKITDPKHLVAEVGFDKAIELLQERKFPFVSTMNHLDGMAINFLKKIVDESWREKVIFIKS